MQKITLGALFIVVLAIIAYVVYGSLSKTIPSSEMATYTSGKYGFSFTYPNTYELSEKEVGNTERGHYSITLIPKESLPLPEAGEGPTAITIDVYQNDIDNLDLFEWITTTEFSNFKLSNGTYVTTSIGKIPAARYAWSGLYEAHVVVFERPGAIVAVTGTYIAPTDKIVSDFEALVQSIEVK